MKNALLLCALLGSAPPAAAAGPEDSVVKVFATICYPNPLKPWARGTPVEVLGTGTVIEGKRILTNSHLVLYATDVRVQGRRGGDKIEARVEALAKDMDLAVLSVNDTKFFDKRPALARGKKLPKPQDSVVVYGFPYGGDDLSRTKGVVSRIEFGESHLVVQVDAAINPGNSGGPGVVGDSMVGLVFGRFSEGQKMGYLIPNEAIDTFLEDIKSGQSRGMVTDVSGAQYQRLENQALRSFLKIDRETRGVLVSPPRERTANYPFEELDVLTRIGPHDVDNDGMVHLPDDLHVGFHAVIAKVARGGTVRVTVIRKGKRVEVALPVSNGDNLLLRTYQGEKPSYFIHGPLVFSPAMADAVASYARLRPELRAMQSPLVRRYYDRVRFPGEQLVVVTSPMFAHKITRGYDEPLGQVVQSVNGIPIKNLTHLVEVLRDCTDEYLTFRFAERGADMLVFKREEMDQATDEILDDHGIAPNRRGSVDALKVWKQKKEK